VQERSTCRGKLYVIGVGPGDHDHMAYRAKSVKIGESEITIGYYAHVSLVEDMIDGKEVYHLESFIRQAKSELDPFVHLLSIRVLGRRSAI